MYLPSIKSRALSFVLLAALSLGPGRSAAQDSSSQSGAAPASPSGPIAALRDALSAACSQSQNDFTRFLTERNKESFSRLAPAARVAFMKRFVLLNEIGKPDISSNPSGRPMVLCHTPAGTAQIQIGGAQVDDNLAFLPVELRDATDTVGTQAMHLNMGLVRENGGWKLLSIGLVLLDLPALEAEWDSAEIATNEQAAVQDLKVIAEAAEAYRRRFSKLPDSLSNLGPPLHGTATVEAAGLIDSDLATGIKNGFAFRYVILGSSASGAQAKFELAATPLTYSRTGLRSFFRDTAGLLHAADHQGAVGSNADPRLP